jgi:hypothetical protein
MVQTIEIPEDGGALFGIILGHEASFIVTLPPANASYLSRSNLLARKHGPIAGLRECISLPTPAIARSGHLRLQKVIRRFL